MGVWAVDGAKVPASNARSVLYQATSGAEGVVLAGDMAVKASPAADGNINIRPGSVVMRNRWLGANGGGQSYGVTLESTEVVAIPSTGTGGGATRYIIATIEDPQYAGATPADPLNYRYEKFKWVSSIPTTYPCYVLAKIVQPANTIGISQSMITDMREIANPREKTIVIPSPAHMDDKGLTLTSRSAYPDGEWFPNYGGSRDTGPYYIEIPYWATRMQIRCEWLSVGGRPKAGYGWYWVSYGPDAVDNTPSNYTEAFAFDFDSSNDTSRQNWILHQEKYIPAAWRGLTQPFVPRATKISPNTAAYNGNVYMSGTSGMVFSIRFLEQTDPNV